MYIYTCVRILLLIELNRIIKSGVAEVLWDYRGTTKDGNTGLLELAAG